MGSSAEPFAATATTQGSSTGDRRTYGDALARSLRLQSPNTLVTRSLKKSQIGISRLSVGRDQLGMTSRVPPEDTFIVALHLTGFPHHELWRQGRRVVSQSYAPKLDDHRQPG